MHTSCFAKTTLFQVIIYKSLFTEEQDSNTNNKKKEKGLSEFSKSARNMFE